MSASIDSQYPSPPIKHLFADGLALGSHHVEPPEECGLETIAQWHGVSGFHLIDLCGVPFIPT